MRREVFLLRRSPPNENDRAYSASRRRTTLSTTWRANRPLLCWTVSTASANNSATSRSQNQLCTSTSPPSAGLASSRRGRSSTSGTTRQHWRRERCSHWLGPVESKICYSIRVHWRGRVQYAHDPIPCVVAQRRTCQRLGADIVKEKKDTWWISNRRTEVRRHKGGSLQDLHR